METSLLSSLQLVELLKAVGEITRLRLLTLLAQGEYNVKDLTQILGQSQPRLSRHLKLLSDAGLIERFQEGSSVFFHITEEKQTAHLVLDMLNALNPKDSQLQRDLKRAEALKSEKSRAAQEYFEAHAAAWNEIRALHAPEAEVEAAMLRAIPGPINLLVDLGVGTGRILELLASRTTRAIGFDVNRNMLAHARARLAAAGIRNAQVRLGDIFTLALEDGVADVVILHQVLHFLDEPGRAVAEAVRFLKPGGHLMIVDFAVHTIEALREDYAHRRLGFDRMTIEACLKREGALPVFYEAIAPQDSSADKLTVSLWLAERLAKS
jgi:ArsR family transcriptional regulator